MARIRQICTDRKNSYDVIIMRLLRDFSSCVVEMTGAVDFIILTLLSVNISPQKGETVAWEPLTHVRTGFPEIKHSAFSPLVRGDAGLSHVGRLAEGVREAPGRVKGRGEFLQLKEKHK